MICSTASKIIEDAAWLGFCLGVTAGYGYNGIKNADDWALTLALFSLIIIPFIILAMIKRLRNQS